MNKRAIIELFNQKYASFIDYISSLSPDEYNYSHNQKWSAGQQIQHIVLCVKPLVQVYGMEKSVIEKSFGNTDRLGRSYEALKNEYLLKLGNGGLAPEKFVPKVENDTSREVLVKSLQEMVQTLCDKIENFTEQDLDTLCIPHPLFGMLTLREMLYNASCHVEHHRELAIQYLKYW